MITFTKEQLIASAHARIEFAEMMLAGELEPLKERTWSIELALARIALASLEAEPVALRDERSGSGGISKKPGFNDLPHGTPLYVAPPAPVSVPDEMYWQNAPVEGSTRAAAYATGWNACRTAMLQGADGNSPVIPEWQAKAEKMAEIHGTSFVVFRNGESPQCAEPSKVIISFTDEGLGHGDTGNFREIVNSSTKDFRENAEASTKCWCRTCRPITLTDMRFVVCPECGNKCCPHANDHRNACTGSNEPGQEGSAYPAAPQQEVKS